MRRRSLPLLLVAASALAACSTGGELGGVRIARQPASAIRASASPPDQAPPALPAERRAVTDVQIGAPPVAADDPVGLAGQVVTAERAIRDPATSPEDLAAAGYLQQNVYRALGRHPEWDAEVRSAVPDDLRPAVEANVSAGRELAQLLTRPREDLPAWRIVSPAPAEELRRYYQEAESAFGVPWQYLAAIHLTETRMGRIRGTSPAGAQGPMQFIPSTWAAYGEGDINDNRDAILAAGRYLAANGAPANMGNALYRYNPTPRYVNAVEAYASQIRADERAFLGYYYWQVYYTTVLGDVWLPVGYESDAARPVTPADLG